MIVGSTVVQEIEIKNSERARKAWQTPQVIVGTLDQAENAGAGAADGGPTGTLS